MKIEYNNLYTHFVFTTLNRMPIILEKFRDRIEKYITGIVKNNGCRMYSIYANPEHVHFLISRSPQLDEECLATIIANSVNTLKIKRNTIKQKVIQMNMTDMSNFINKQLIRKKTKNNDVMRFYVLKR